MAIPRAKLIKYGVLAAIVLALILYFVYQQFKEVPLSYNTALPQVRDIKQQVYATGTLAGKVEVDVGAQASGQIKKLFVKKGDKVKAGDLLCELDPEIQENELLKAEAQEKLIQAQIRSKDAQIELYKAEYTRQQNLLKTAATSQQTYQQAKANYIMALADLDALKAQYDQAKVSVANAKTNLNYTRIVAPMDGTVYAIPVEEGQTVNATQSTPTIIRLADLDTMTVEAEISEADVVKVKPDMSARFTIMGLPNQYFDAKLQSIDPAPTTAESTTTTTSSSSSSTQAIYYNALLDVDNKDGILRIDMTAEVEITIAEAKGAKAIPIAAVQNEDSKNRATVYQLVNNKVVPVKVKLGVRDDQYVQVLNDDFDLKTPLVIGSDVASAAKTAASPRGHGPRVF